MKKQFLKLNTAVSLALVSATNTVSAALPAAGTVNATTGVTATDPVSIITGLMQSGVGIAALAVSGLTVLGVAWTTYSSFVEARKKGEWKDFGVTASVGTVLSIGVVLMAILAVDYVS